MVNRRLDEMAPLAELLALKNRHRRLIGQLLDQISRPQRQIMFALNLSLRHLTWGRHSCLP